MPDAPFVTVIVPVYNDAARLRVCLAALCTQDYPADRYAVRVVDNGSPEEGAAALTAVVAAWADGAPAVYLMHEPAPGSYAARNRALASAQGAIVAFTDADCQPAPGWLAAGVAALQARPEAAFVAGHIEARCQNTERPRMAELYEYARGFEQQAAVERNYGQTANLFVWLERFETVGPFDASLMSGGDFEWGRRAVAAGYLPYYAPEARVVHPVRSSLRAVVSKVRRITGGHYDRGPYTFRRLARLVVADVISPPRYCRRIFALGKLQGGRQKAQYAVLITGLRLVTAAERIRRYFGGAALRH